MTRQYNILLIDDDLDQGEQLRDAVEEINSEGLEFTVSCKIATNEKDATYLLYTESFDGLIVDLQLNQGEEVGSGIELSGNTLLNHILEKELVPVIVRTGTPEMFNNKFEDSNNIIKIYAKGEANFYDIVLELIKINESSLFKIFGTRGKIRESINQLFWQVIPECFSSWNGELTITMPDKEKTIIRYISSWLINKYNFIDNQYTTQDPIEMYMFPNTIEQVCTGDIFIKDKQYFFVLTPACDLANQKTDNILLANIVSHSVITRFFQEIEEFKDLDPSSQESKYNKKMNKLSRWFRNGELPRFHFLPKVSFFDGGFIDFQQLSSVSYDSENRRISDNDYEKLGVLTDSFVKEIISRFGAYYQRQGQPEFDQIRVLEYLLDKEG